MSLTTNLCVCVFKFFNFWMLSHILINAFTSEITEGHRFFLKDMCKFYAWVLLTDRVGSAQKQDQIP